MTESESRLREQISEALKREHLHIDSREMSVIMQVLSGGLGELLKMAKEVPDPENEGYCESCGYRLELIKIGDAYKWQHLPCCWYRQLQAALAKFQSAGGPAGTTTRTAATGNGPFDVP